MSEIDDSVLANSEVASFEKAEARTGHTAEPQFLISESGMREAAEEICLRLTALDCFQVSIVQIIARHAAQAPAQTAATNLVVMPENRACQKCGWIHATGSQCPAPNAMYGESAEALIAKLAQGLRDIAAMNNTSPIRLAKKIASALLSLPGVPQEEKK